MTIRTTCGRLGTALLLSALAGAAQAEGGGPVYKDSERFFEAGAGPGWAPPDRDGAPRAPRRTVTGGPGYVGSDYGLGKPAFTGLGSRPDWGRSE